VTALVRSGRARSRLERAGAPHDKGTSMAPSTSDLLTFHHVDVFSDEPMGGNGLTVVHAPSPRDPLLMQRITRELRQFETIFLFEEDANGATARIFTEEEELFFAGHPVLGAAAVLHQRHRPQDVAATWVLRVGGRPLTVHVQQTGRPTVLDASMNQGAASTSATLTDTQRLDFAAVLGVPRAELHETLPAQVVSTGLPYLVLPVSAPGLALSRVAVPDLEERLGAVGAKFVYVLDPEAPEGRTWDNGGRVEDVATGSAAGPAAAYLISHDVQSSGRPFRISQGRFTGRPSSIRVHQDPTGSMWVGGPVTPFSDGVLRIA
jgi:trans-2,3-dihydro-3-hydroxyanthranilate isomerase